MNSRLVVFKNKEIRRALHNDEWWFSIVDVCGALTGSADAGAYWRKLKQRLLAEGSEVVTNCHGLKLTAPDGKLRMTDCANTEGIFRIISLSPPPKPSLLNAGLPRSDMSGYRKLETLNLLQNGQKTFIGQSDIQIPGLKSGCVELQSGDLQKIRSLPIKEEKLPVMPGENWKLRREIRSSLLKTSWRSRKVKNGLK